MSAQSVKAVFRCNWIKQRAGYQDDPGQVDVELQPIYRDKDAESERTRFWDATPTGELTMCITNPEAAGFFEPGKEYLLTFQEAELPPAKR